MRRCPGSRIAEDCCHAAALHSRKPWTPRIPNKLALGKHVTALGCTTRPCDQDCFRILDGRTSRFGSGSGNPESNGALGVSRDEQREVVGMRKVGSPPERVMRLPMNFAQVSAFWGRPRGLPHEQGTFPAKPTLRAALNCSVSL